MMLAMADRRPAPSHPWMEEPLPRVELSIEVFPPKGPEATSRLWTNVEQFVAIGPRFISVTCGAGGAGNDGTLPLVCRIQDGFGDDELGRWFRQSGLVAETPRHLAGPELTVVIWTARRPAAAVDGPTHVARRNAA